LHICDDLGRAQTLFSLHLLLQAVLFSVYICRMLMLSTRALTAAAARATALV
jgi:hypothetical protein